MERVLKRFGIQTATGTDRAGKTRTSGRMEAISLSLSLSLSFSLWVEVEKYGAVVMLMRLYRQTFSSFFTVSLYQAKVKLSKKAFFPALRLPLLCFAFVGELSLGKFGNAGILTSREDNSV